MPALNKISNSPEKYIKKEQNWHLAFHHWWWDHGMFLMLLLNLGKSYISFTLRLYVLLLYYVTYSCYLIGCSLKGKQHLRSKLNLNLSFQCSGTFKICTTLNIALHLLGCRSSPNRKTVAKLSLICCGSLPVVVSTRNRTLNWNQLLLVAE